MAFSLKNLLLSMAVLAVSTGLVACSSSGSISPLAFAPISSTKLQTGNGLLSELNGGILPPNALAALSQADKKRALTAEYEALETASLGQKTTWKSQSGRASGEVSAGTPYQVGAQNCRQYTHTATINGVTLKGQGAACRNQDGSWTPLS